MRRIVIALDDSLDLWLSKHVNQSQVVRDALTLYKGDITTDTLNGIRSSYVVVANQLQVLESKINELDSKLDYIAGKVQGK